MEPYVETIRTALASDASAELRAAGVAACRSVLATLDPAPQALAPANALAAQMPQLIAMLGKMDINQLLDVAIERLRKLNAASPSPIPAEPPRRMTIPLVPIPGIPRGGS